MRKNIFIREYDNAHENVLTENLIDFLSNTNIKIFKKFLGLINVQLRHNDFGKINFEMQLKEKESIPDAVISDGNDLYIVIEVKRFKDKIKSAHLKQHFDALKSKAHSKKALLILTNDLTEPRELKQFRIKHESKNIRVGFLNWEQIFNFVKNISHSSLGEKEVFLRDQYLEYLKEECKDMEVMGWGGFKKGEDIEKKWIDYLEWHQVLDGLVEMMTNYIKNMTEEWIKSKSIKNKKTDIYQSFRWALKRNICRLIVGIERHQNNKDMRGVYVWWNFSRVTRSYFEKHHKKFNNIKRCLINKGFKFYKNTDSDIYKYLPFNEITRENNISKQQEIVFSFINKALNDFERSGLKRLIKQVH